MSSYILLSMRTMFPPLSGDFIVISELFSKDLRARFCSELKFFVALSFLIFSISLVVCLTINAKAGFWLNGGNLFDFLLNFFGCCLTVFEDYLLSSSLSGSSSHMVSLSCSSRFKSQIALKSSAVRFRATSSAFLVCFEYILLNSNFLANLYLLPFQTYP